MRVRNRYVRFFGLMAVLTLLLSTSVMSCCPCRMGGDGICRKSSKGPEPSATVLGMAWDDADGDGVRDPAESAIPGAYMKLIGSTTYGPKNRLADGTYSFTVTPSGYTLRCSASGFVTQDRSISLINGEIQTQNFGMKH